MGAWSLSRSVVTEPERQRRSSVVPRWRSGSVAPPLGPRAERSAPLRRLDVEFAAGAHEGAEQGEGQAGGEDDDHARLQRGMIKQVGVAFHVELPGVCRHVVLAAVLREGKV